MPPQRHKREHGAPVQEFTPRKLRAADGTRPAAGTGVGGTCRQQRCQLARSTARSHVCRPCVLCSSFCAATGERHAWHGGEPLPAREQPGPSHLAAQKNNNDAAGSSSTQPSVGELHDRRGPSGHRDAPRLRPVPQPRCRQFPIQAGGNPKSVRQKKSWVSHALKRPAVLAERTRSGGRGGAASSFGKPMQRLWHGPPSCASPFPFPNTTMRMIAPPLPSLFLANSLELPSADHTRASAPWQAPSPQRMAPHGRYARF